MKKLMMIAVMMMANLNPNRGFIGDSAQALALIGQNPIHGVAVDTPNLHVEIYH